MPDKIVNQCKCKEQRADSICPSGIFINLIHKSTIGRSRGFQSATNSDKKKPVTSMLLTGRGKIGYLDTNLFGHFFLFASVTGGLDELGSIKLTRANQKNRQQPRRSRRLSKYDTRIVFRLMIRLRQCMSS